jgi:hypothetical protein
VNQKHKHVRHKHMLHSCHTATAAAAATTVIFNTSVLFADCLIDNIYALHYNSQTLLLQTLFAITYPIRLRERKDVFQLPLTVRYAICCIATLFNRCPDRKGPYFSRFYKALAVCVYHVLATATVHYCA